MQIPTFKMIMQQVLALSLSLALIVGFLVVDPMNHMLVRDAEARVAARGPWGGAVAAGPRGAVAVGPRGGAVAATPRSYMYTGTASVTAGPRRAYVEGPRGGKAYVGPRAAAVRGAYGGGAIVWTYPVGARPVTIAGVTYYVAKGVYYRPVYQGSTVVYQQVPNPKSR
jgi:hypothetical protein